MAELKDLEKKLETMLEAFLDKGVDLKEEAVKILAIANNVRITMINEMCAEADPEQWEGQLPIPSVMPRVSLAQMDVLQPDNDGDFEISPKEPRDGYFIDKKEAQKLADFIYSHLHGA